MRKYHVFSGIEGVTTVPPAFPERISSVPPHMSSSATRFFAAKAAASEGLEKPVITASGKTCSRTGMPPEGMTLSSSTRMMLMVSSLSQAAPSVFRFQSIVKPKFRNRLYSD